MTMKKILLLLTVLLVVQSLSATRNSEKRQMDALRVSDRIKIDGFLDEEIWQKAYYGADFKTYEPLIGNSASQRSEIRILYDNSAIYVGALLLDEQPEKIYRALSKRDQWTINADKFWVTISPYNDGQNYFRFEVTSANVQSDIKVSSRAQDRAWDAVWFSEARITDEGWIVEMRIPYDAIRFPKEQVQTWGINFWRMVGRSKEISTWNPVDKTLGSWLGQAGELTGIENIEAPFRLALYPYVSSYVQHDSENGKSDFSLNGGLDLKYGINESFTLDMTLIPDFGQTTSDNKVLNLSPYETKYSENRQFFTEGTELFNKAGLFYSRRIGGKPENYGSVEDDLADGEEILENPAETELINATKISGRTRNGLGIGVFNAMTREMRATISDEEGDTRKVVTQPFTNYNMLVLDKTIGNYSYINLINTNTYKPSNRDRDDVLGTAFKMADRNNEFVFQGNMAMSMKYDPKSSKTEFGEYYDLNAGKVNGSFYYNYNFKLLSDTYNPNDMGYLSRNNELIHRVDIRYRIFEPFWKMLNMSANFLFVEKELYAPRRFSERLLKFESRGTFLNNLSMGGSITFRPGEQYDYFEPRVDGYRFALPSSHVLRYWLSSDYRKVLAIDASMGLKEMDGKGDTEVFKNTNFWWSLGPRFRFNDKFSVNHKFEYSRNDNNLGYVAEPVADSIVFGDRDIQRITNTLWGSYVFNNKSSLSLKMRHYWSKVEYNKFYDLEDSGYLTSNIDYHENKDQNYNAFNVDLVYSWNFAPGSFMNVMWKNSIFTDDNIVEPDFFNNFNKMLSSSQSNSFSVKISYYLDYKQLRKRRS
jgi:hypothetical protein